MDLIINRVTSTTAINRDPGRKNNGQNSAKGSKDSSSFKDILNQKIKGL
jgi:hypothetical protein